MLAIGVGVPSTLIGVLGIGMDALDIDIGVLSIDSYWYDKYRIWRANFWQGVLNTVSILVCKNSNLS